MKFCNFDRIQKGELFPLESEQIFMKFAQNVENSVYKNVFYLLKTKYYALMITGLFKTMCQL